MDNDLLNLGFGMMANASQPGATPLGALGAGGMNMMQGRQQQADLALKQGQIQQMQLQNQMIPLQMQQLQTQVDLFKGLPQLLGQPNSTPSTAGAGQPLSSTATSPAPPGDTVTRPVNNPGNLRPIGATTGFRQFDTPQDGYNAMVGDITAKINGSPAMGGKPATLRNMISAYAPPTENDTSSYIKNVSVGSGIDPDQTLTAHDIPKIMPFMIKQEGNAGAVPQFNQPVPAAPNNLLRNLMISRIEPRLGAELQRQDMAPVIAAQEEAAKLPYAAQEGAAKERGSVLEKNAEKVDNEATNAVEANYLLDNVKQAASKVPLGKFSDYKESYLSLKNAIGVSSPEEDKKLANFQDLDKNALALRTQAVKQITSRPTQMEFIAVGKALPNKTLSEGGFNMITNQMQSLNDFKIAKQTAQTAWRQNHPTLEGFETKFNSEISPSVFLVNRLSPDEFHEMANNLQQTKQGKSILSGLMAKMKNAAASGYLGQ